MEMTKTKRIALLGILTAMYVVMSLTLKINLIGNIALDLGYIPFAVACCYFGPVGAVVGCIGCGLESVLFSAYGFSISWFVGNLIIGLGCGFLFKATKNIWLRIVSVIVFVALGILLAKTIIECNLYGIPFEIKIVKNLVAFGIDTVVMIIGVIFFEKIKKFLR